MAEYFKQESAIAVYLKHGKSYFKAEIPLKVANALGLDRYRGAKKQKLLWKIKGQQVVVERK